jgi:hypothetical protein
MDVKLELGWGINVLILNNTTREIESYSFSEYEKLPGAFLSSVRGRFVLEDLQELSKNLQTSKLSTTEVEKQLNDTHVHAEIQCK